jgi:flagellar hook-associated protein 2
MPTSSVSTSFGNITVDNGTPRLGSKVFGVDLNELVKNLTEAKKIPIQQQQVKIDANTTKIGALKDLKTLSNALATAARDLRNPSVLMGGTDVFKAKAAFAQSSTSTPATDILRVTAGTTAQVDSFTVKVNRLARADVINSSTTFGGTTATPVTADGTLSINGTAIALTTGMSLADIESAIDTVSSTTGVKADVVKINDTTYGLTLKASDTGKAIQLTGSAAGVLTDLGLAASGATDTSLSAELSYNGVTVTRATNTVKDLVLGITFDLLSAEPGTTVSISIAQDAGAVKDSMIKFVDAYNALLTFSKEQRAINADGTVPEDSILFNDSTLRSITSGLQGLIGGAVGGVSGLNNLREAGISLSSENLLVIDDTKLDAAILEKPDEVRNLFTFQSSSTNSSLFTLNRPAALGSFTGQNIQVNVTSTNTDGKALTASIVYGGTTYAARIENGIIYAPDDSALKGFAFGYTGPVVTAGTPATYQSSTIQVTQGIADGIGGFLEGYLKQDNGTLDIALQELEDKNDRIQNQITRMEAQVELFRTRMADRFLAVEQQVSQLDTLKNSLQAQFAAMSGDSN